MNKGILYQCASWALHVAMGLILAVAVVVALTGCSVNVNVIVAPGASLGIDSNNSRTRAEVVTHYNELVELIPVGEVVDE